MRLFRALRHRNYLLFFMGQGVSLIGTWMQQIAEVWLAYRLTRSAFYLGMVGFASQIPTFILAPLAGAWGDRANKHRLLIIAQVLAMLQAFVMAYLVLSHRITFSQLIVLSVIGGMIDALEIPVRQSFVIEMVESPEDLGNAIALNSSLVNSARLIGPSIAGILIGLIGEGWCFFINGVSFVAVIAALLAMKLATRPKTLQKPPLARVLREGFSYVLSSPPIATLLLLLATVSLVGSSYTVLVPIFATRVLQGGPHTLGFLMAGSGVGALGAALFLASRKSVIGLGPVILRGTFFFGCCLVLFSLSRVFWLSWLAMLIGGFGMMSATASINTVLQTIVDDDKRGRVMSFFTMAFIGMAPLGNLAGGTVAQHLGAPMSVRIAGCLLLLAALLFRFHLPTLRKHIRPIYSRLGILPEVAAGLQATTPSVKPHAG
jgi:MFS family permease